MASLPFEYLKQEVDRLSVQDQIRLVQHVVTSLRQAHKVEAADAPAQELKPQDLYGIWRDHFPPDVDIDAILQEIRHEWEEELDEWRSRERLCRGHARLVLVPHCLTPTGPAGKARL